MGRYNHLLACVSYQCYQDVSKMTKKSIVRIDYGLMAAAFVSWGLGFPFVALPIFILVVCVSIYGLTLEKEE